MRRRRLGLILFSSILVAACGGDDQGPQQSPLVIAKTTVKSGDEQTGPVGTALGNPLRVMITRDGEPVEGEDVDWVAGQGGAFSDETDSDEAGIASAVWTLGPEIGNHAATASIEDATGSPLNYTATATDGTGPPPGPTIQVLGPAGGNRFEPSQVTITAGQTVTWSWPEGALSHNVVPEDGDNPIPSGPVTNGPETYTFTFNEIGVYRFFCLSHGGVGGVGMSGRVIVTDAEN